MQAVIEHAHTPPRDLNPLAPPRLAAVIDRALAKSPDQRYQSIDEMAEDLQSIAATASLPKNPAFVSDRRRRRVTVAVVAAISLAIAVGWFAWQAANKSWALQQIPEIIRLAKAGKSLEAHDLSVHARNYLPIDPKLSQLILGVATTLKVSSEPSGAEVYLKRLDRDSPAMSPPWTRIGTTPILNLEVARGNYLVSVEKEGYEPFRRTWSDLIVGEPDAPIRFDPIPIDVRLIPSSKAPHAMVFVPGGDYRLGPWRRPTEKKARLDDFFIDKFEVTNREYKTFVDALGYETERFWTNRFVDDGRGLSREEAMAMLIDRTGKPGPRGWSNGTYPNDKADHPVTNITWYEAAAYAAFRGKSLPTIFQWEKAAKHGVSNNFVGQTMPWGIFQGSIEGLANLNRLGAVPVGSFEFGMSPFGCYDMAGNVSEWCLNESANGYLVSGGSCASLPQVWDTYGAYPAFRHSDAIGFRCVLNPSNASSDQGAIRIDVNDKVPEYTPEPEAEVREWIKEYYQYDKELPPEKWIRFNETHEWRCERIEYNGEQGQRAIAYLYLPKRFAPPHQVVHLFPAGDVTFGSRTIPQSIEADYAPLLRSGRAVFAVVLSGFPERETAAGFGGGRGNPDSIEYVEWYARNIAEMRRGLDYLLMRPDIDSSRVAFLGVSFGGGFMVLPAIESRYRAVITSGVCLEEFAVHRKAYSVNFIPLIRGPTLLFHGRYDEGSPLKTVAEPVYNLLPEPKDRHIHDGGHRSDREYQAREVNAWLDETIGPVARPAAN
jgi:formylglycine-generating enzyme required for sulfatase activity/dienelactone hydrolase